MHGKLFKIPISKKLSPLVVQALTRKKPLVVSGILLALQDSDFSTEYLSDANEYDGFKNYRAISDTLDKLEVEPSVKKRTSLRSIRAD